MDDHGWRVKTHRELECTLQEKVAANSRINRPKTRGSATVAVRVSSAANTQ